MMSHCAMHHNSTYPHYVKFSQLLIAGMRHLSILGDLMAIKTHVLWPYMNPLCDVIRIGVTKGLPRIVRRFDKRQNARKCPPIKLPAQ